MGILEGVTSQDKAHHSTGAEEKDTYLTKSKTIFIELYITVSSLRDPQQLLGILVVFTGEGNSKFHILAGNYYLITLI